MDMLESWNKFNLRIVFDALVAADILPDTIEVKKAKKLLDEGEMWIYSKKIVTNQKVLSIIKGVEKVCEAIGTLQYSRSRLTSFEMQLSDAQHNAQRSLGIILDLFNDGYLYDLILSLTPVSYKGLKALDAASVVANELVNQYADLLEANGICSKNLFLHFLGNKKLGMGSKFFKNLTFQIREKRLILHIVHVVSGASLDFRVFLQWYLTGVIGAPLDRYSMFTEREPRSSSGFRDKSEAIIAAIFLKEVENILKKGGSFSLTSYFKDIVNMQSGMEFNGENVINAINNARQKVVRPFRKLQREVNNLVILEKPIEDIWEAMKSYEHGDVLLKSNYNPFFEESLDSINKELLKIRGSSFGKKVISFSDLDHESKSAYYEFLRKTPIALYLALLQKKTDDYKREFFNCINEKMKNRVIVIPEIELTLFRTDQLELQLIENIVRALKSVIESTATGIVMSVSNYELRYRYQGDTLRYILSISDEDLKSLNYKLTIHFVFSLRERNSDRIAELASLSNYMKVSKFIKRIDNLKIKLYSSRVYGGSSYG